MYELNSTNPASGFRPKPGHHPRNRQERYKRVHRYVSLLATAASSQLQQSLLLMREAADQMPTAVGLAAAGKEFTDTEFQSAIKELVCLWIHLEAVDQGGAGMPTWLINFLKLALYATDFLVAQPTATSIMNAHAHCKDLIELYSEVGKTTANHLGLGEYANLLGPGFVPLLTDTRSVRQNSLKDALTADVDHDDTMMQ